MHMLRGFLLVPSLLALIACGPQIRTQADFDPEIDYSSYETFAWISEHPMVIATSPAPTLSPFLEQRIQTAISATLTNKGFTRVADPEQADFVVGFSIGLQDKVRVTSYPTTSGAYYGRRRGYYYGYGETVDVRNYTEGTLAIDIFDVATRNPAWHGWGSGTVRSTQETDDEKRAKRYREITDLILASFPPNVK